MRPSCLPVVALLAACCCCLLPAVQGQTQVNFCWLGYGPQQDQQYGSTVPFYWSSQVTATLTLNTSAALSSLTGAYSVTAVSGTRSVASLSGNNAVGSVTQLSLTPLASCPFGCDNVLWPARNAPSEAGVFNGGLFDGLGLSFSLALPQVDISGCDTSTWKVFANNPNENGSSTQQSNCDDEINVSGQAAVYAVGAALPGVCTIPAPAGNYTCGIGPYSFASMATGPDLYGSFNGYTLWLRLCGAVSQGFCVSQFGNSVMACQIGGTSLTLGYHQAYAQALTYSALGPAITFGYANGVNGNAGINFTSADGELCGSIGSRKFLGLLQCGPTAQILNYTESPECNYHYIIQTPLACPPTQNLAFCEISSTAPVASYSTWMTAISGVINGTMAPSAQQANYGQSGVTYIANNFVGSSGSISYSTLYAATNSSTLAAPSGSYTGAVSSTASISIVAVGAWEGNDNVVYYTASNSTLGWLTSNGLSFNNSGSYSQVFYSAGSTYINLYFDAYLGYAYYYSTVQLLPLGTGTSLPASWCTPPTLTTGTTSSVTFGFCYITYDTNLYQAYTNSYYWGSTTTGTITATGTSNQGQYLVTGISGTRTVSTSLGFQAASGSSASVTLGNVPSTSSTSGQYVYVNSPLVFNGSATDGITGLTFSLSSNQTDPSGCTGNAITAYGQAVVCNGGSGSGSLSYMTSLTLVQGSSPPTCIPVVQTPVPYVCGLGSYNFSSLSAGPDLNFTQNGYTIAFRMCGAVSQPYCVSKFGSNTMACQYSSSTNLYELAAAQSPFGAPEFSYVNGVDGSGGILMIVKDGQSCNSDTLYPRMLYVTLLCETSSTSSSLLYYEEWATLGGPICWYNLTVLTPLACAPAPVVSSSTTCTIGNYNFTGLATGSDLVGGFEGYGIYMRLCGAVSQQWCVATAAGGSTQVCQFYNYQSAATGMAYTTSAVNNTVFSYTNGANGNAGISYFINNGDVCGSLGPRKVQGILTCATTTQMISFLESPTCTYTINITTPLACNGGYGATGLPAVLATQQFAFCQTLTMSNVVPGYTVTVSQMSGTVTATQMFTGSTAYTATAVTGTRSIISFNGTTSTVALTGISTALGASNIIYYSASVPLVYVDAAGLALTLASSQTDLSGCTGSVILTAYQQIICGNGFASQSGFSTVWTALTTGVTAPTCQITTSALTLQTPGYCGVAPYNLISLASGPDLSVTMGGYTIFMRLCGAVSQPNCVATFGVNCQICQWASASSQYEIASLLSPSGETTFAYANGVNIAQGLVYTITDGAYCGSGNTYPRTVNGTITCGATNNVTYYNQLPNVECLYVINLVTPLVCSSSSSAAPAVLPSSSSAVSVVSVSSSVAAAVNSSSSSSSSLSGGAIAGIVIGSVVGAALIICLCIAVCMTRGRADKKDTGNAARGSAYNEVEASRNPESHVEMEQVTQ